METDVRAQRQAAGSATHQTRHALERVAVNRIPSVARTHLLRKRCLGPSAEYTHPIDRNTLWPTVPRPGISVDSFRGFP